MRELYVLKASNHKNNNKKRMEKLVSIIQQHPLVARPYTAKDGTPMVFNSRGFLLTDGIDEFYAEMTGDAALACPEYDRTVWHRMQGCIKTRAYTDKNGATRYENQVVISRMV